MTEYKYKDLTQYGYKKVKIPRSLHNRVFLNRTTHISDKWEYYMKGDELVVHRHFNIFTKMFLILLFPINAIMIGLPEAYRETRRILRSKKYGSFASNFVTISRHPELEEYLIDK